MQTYPAELKIVIIGCSGHDYVIIEALMKSQVCIMGYMEAVKKFLDPCSLSGRLELCK